MGRDNRMGWFRKKKKQTLFGGNVPPNCVYCQHNSGKNGEVICALHQTPVEESCKKYQYDPLQREPSVAPPLRTSQFSPEDFQL